MQYEYDVPLKNMITMRVGGPARVFARAETDSDVVSAVLYAEERDLPLFILGGGSNVVVSDQGWNGLVLKVATRGVAWSDRGDEAVEVVAAAGETWDDLVAGAVIRGLYGIENLSGIPGTVGGAPIQNIGAYGVEIKDSLLWVDALSIDTRKIVRFPAKACAFEYRESFFKTPEGRRFVILRVALRLLKRGTVSAQYSDIAERIRAVPDHMWTPGLLRSLVLVIRGEKFPSLKNEGSAGSFFKNPIVSEDVAGKLRAAYPDMPMYSADGGVKLPAAWLIDRIGGFKGMRDRGVEVYRKQALVLVNTGRATAEDVCAISETIRQAISQKTGIMLSYEVSFVGDVPTAAREK